MKMKRWVLLAASLCLLLSGCTKSNIVRGNQDEYGDLPQPVDGIVWEQVWEDLDAIYADTYTYPFAETVNAGVYPDENMVKFYLLLNTDIPADEAADYATEVIKGFNDLIAVQNNAYTKSGEDSYGGYVSQYGIYVMVGADSTKADKDNWILEDTIPAGEYRPVSGESATE